MKLIGFTFPIFFVWLFHHLFCQGIPLFTGVALALPLCVLRPAALTKERGFDFTHNYNRKKRVLFLAIDQR